MLVFQQFSNKILFRVGTLRRCNDQIRELRVILQELVRKGHTGIRRYGSGLGDINGTSHFVPSCPKETRELLRLS